METVGFIGLGNLGSPMAQNIQRQGYQMVVYDIQEGATKLMLERGARLADSPRQVGEFSDVVFTSLPGPSEVEEVALGLGGIIEGIRPGSVYIDLSTSRPSLIRHIGKQFAQKGAEVIDAPVFGGPSDAEVHYMIVMPSGDRNVYEKLLPVFEAFADKVVYQGDLGQGSVCKLVLNMMTLSVRQVAAEGLSLGIKSGLNLSALMEAGSRGVLATQADLLNETVFSGDFDTAGFRQALSRKDLGLATELGKEMNVPLPVANIVEQIAIQCTNKGWADKGTQVIYRLQEEASGIKMRLP